MKSDSLTLSPETVAEYLPECKAGERKTITVDIVVGKRDDSGLTASIESVGYEEPEEAPVPEKKSSKKKSPAVMAILSKK